MEISIYEPVDLIITLMKTTINGMTDRIRRLRQESFDTQPSLSIERALIETEFYKENEGKYPIPILRNVPNNKPEYSEAYRLRKFLEYFASVQDKELPPTSLLREFLGGSSFRY